MRETCGHCGLQHLTKGACPRVKSIEYFPHGGIKRIEYHDPNPPAQWPSIPSYPWPTYPVNPVNPWPSPYPSPWEPVNPYITPYQPVITTIGSPVTWGGGYISGCTTSNASLAPTVTSLAPNSIVSSAIEQYVLQLNAPMPPDIQEYP